MSAFATADDVAVRLDTTFTEGEITRVEALLDDVSEAIRVVTGQQVNAAANTVTLPGKTGRRLFLPSLPAQLPSSVTINGTAYTDWSFDASTGSLLRRGGWSVTDDNGFPYPVVVTYASGYTQPPAELKRICCQAVIRALNTTVGLRAETAGDWMGQFDATGVTLTDQEISEARNALGVAVVG